MFIPIETYTSLKRRTGFGAAAKAGTIPSSSGSASVAPRPRSIVRRGKDFPVMIIVSTSSSFGRENCLLRLV